MNEKPALPPLGIDDIAAYGPDRDSERVFEPNETWCAACEAMVRGYPAATVAGLLLDLPADDLAALAEHWRDHTLTTLENPAWNGRDFLCPDLRLALALYHTDTDEARCGNWSCAPTLDPASLWETVAEFDRLKAQSNALLAALKAIMAVPGDADASSVAIAISHDLMEEARAAIAAAEGEGTR